MNSKEFRVQFRKQQLGTLLKQEVQAALNSKNNSRPPINLGLVNFETDFEIFGLLPPLETAKKFNYKKQNLQEMDHLLGIHWDIKVSDTMVHFITEFKINVQNNMLKLKLKTATFRGEFESENYRKILLTHINKVPSCLESDQEDD